MDSKKANTNNRRRSDKNNSKKKAKSWKKILLNCLILLVFFIAVGYISATVIFNGLKANTVEITDNNFWQSQSTALIYDSQGGQIGKLSEKVVSWTDICRDLKDGEEKTEENSLFVCQDPNQVAKVSPYYIEGLIATEDQGFMNHHGVNFPGMIRVTLSAIVNGDTSGGGGSSITMQLAKLLYLEPVTMYDEDGNKLSWIRGDKTKNAYDIDAENGIAYKLSQMALAMKIEDKYNKEEIMENYVNTMYFGKGGYGIKNAAKYYYNVSPEKLSLAQSATLAGMTQSPNTWNPYKNPEGTTERRNLVLSRMESEGYITTEEADAAKAEDISADLVDHSGDEEARDERLKYYNDVNLYVLDELEGLLGTNADLNTGGMKIHTTIDPGLQKGTIDTLDTDNQVIYQQEGAQAGTAMIDVDTGGILALGNGFDGDSPYAYAYNEFRNPGSTAKPLTAYAPSIEYLGYSTAHIFDDKKTYYTGTDTVVQNYSRTYSGNVTMMDALSESLNTTAVQAFQQVVSEIGLEEMSSWFERVGLFDWKIERNKEENPLVYESYALGAFGSTPLEMASAFATFANGGTYNAPHIIDYIEFDEQSPYYDELGSKWYPEYESHKAMEPSTAYLITKMLNPDNKGSFTSTADVPELDTAIKTGTSNWGPNNFGIPEENARDRWTVGYTPDVATAVWYGYEYSYESQGYTFYQLPQQPLQIWKALMQYTVNPDDEKLADGKFVQPDNVVSKQVNGVTQYFVQGTDELTNVTTAPSVPYIHISTAEANKVVITWDSVENAANYNIYIDGQVYDTLPGSGNRKTLLYDDFYSVGCKSSYEVGVQTVGTNGLKSGINSYTIQNDVSNCSEPEEKEDDKEANKDEDKNTDKDADKAEDKDKDSSNSDDDTKD